MPTVRVFLRCATPTSRQGGLFDTFVNVTAASLAQGAHIWIARDRARLLGYGGPYRTAEVRVLSAGLMATGPASQAEAVAVQRVRMRDRLDARFGDADGDVVSSPERIQPLSEAPHRAVEIRAVQRR